MFCYAVFDSATNKQIRVFSYDPFINNNDHYRAKKLAIKFAQKLHDAGNPATVEEFGCTDFGILVFNSEKQ